MLWLLDYAPAPIPPSPHAPPRILSSRMRAFGAPRSFEMRRIREEGSDVLRRFVSDAWDWSGGDMMALWASSRHPREIVHTELLPAARCDIVRYATRDKPYVTSAMLILRVLGGVTSRGSDAGTKHIAARYVTIWVFGISRAVFWRWSSSV